MVSGILCVAYVINRSMSKTYCEPTYTTVSPRIQYCREVPGWGTLNSTFWHRTLYHQAHSTLPLTYLLIRHSHKFENAAKKKKESYKGAVGRRQEEGSTSGAGTTCGRPEEANTDARQGSEQCGIKPEAACETAVCR